VGQRCRGAYIAVPEVSGNPTLAQQRCLNSNIAVGRLNAKPCFWLPRPDNAVDYLYIAVGLGLARPMEAAKYPGVGYLDSGCSRHMTGDASLLSNLIPYDGPRVTFGGSNDFGLTKGLGNLVYKGLTIQDVSYVEGLNYNLLSINKDEEVNKEDRMKPTEFIPFRSLSLKISQRNPDSDGAEPSGNFGQPSNISDISNGDNSGNGDPVPIHPETPTTSVLQPKAELDQPVNPNQHNLRWLRDHPSQQIIGDIQSGVRTKKAASPPQEQNQEATEEEEFQRLIQSQVLEILTTPCEISNQTQLEILEKSAEIPEQSAIPEIMEKEVEVQRHSGKAEKESQMAEEEVSQTPIAILEEPNEAEDSDSLSRYISNFALDEAEGESERTLKITDEEDVQEDAESLPLQLFQRISSPHQVTNFHFHSSSIPTLPDEIPETWTKKVQGLIESALASQHASFRQEIELMEAKHTELIEKSEEKHSADLKEISKSIEKTLEIISLLSKTMSLLQMDIRSALAIASANQVVTKDYLKVIIDNQKEAYKLFRLIGAHSGNRKMEVILQQHSPSPIPQLPIAVNEGEASYVPSHLHMTNLILEAQQRNPENSAQHLSSSGLDGTEFIGAVADHFSDAAQTEERRENLRRIKELWGTCRASVKLPDLQNAKGTEGKQESNKIRYSRMKSKH
ncbi:unnamed protein product, partial [Cuscuta campestris]